MKKPKPINMSGNQTLYTFSYLLNGASSLSQSAKEHPEGSNYCRISAVLLSAFAIEAYFNYVGEEVRPPKEVGEKAEPALWSIEDGKKYSWEKKLELISQHLKMENESDFSRRPFQTLTELFEFRNLLAHGRTQTEKINFKHRSKDEPVPTTFPRWLEKHISEKSVRRILEDTRKIIELIHEKAGFPKFTLNVISEGEFKEQE